MESASKHTSVDYGEAIGFSTHLTARYC